MIEIVDYSPIYRKPVTKLIREFHAEALGDYGLKMTKTVEQFEDAHGKSSFVLLDDSKVIGVIGGFVTEQPMSGNLIYQETVWYVARSHRRHGVKLIHHLEKWCKEEGIDQIVMAYMMNSKAEKLLKFYERIGYRPMEMHLIKDIA